MSVEETVRSLEDWDFLVAMMQGGCKFTHIPLFGVSVHQDSNSDQRNETAATCDWTGYKFIAGGPQLRQNRENADIIY